MGCGESVESKEDSMQAKKQGGHSMAIVPVEISYLSNDKVGTPTHLKTADSFPDKQVFNPYLVFPEPVSPEKVENNDRKPRSNRSKKFKTSLKVTKT